MDANFGPTPPELGRDRGLGHDPTQKVDALEDLFIQVSALAEWVGRTMGGDGLDGPITKYLTALQQVVDQNLDEENGRITMHQGVAPDRRVSIEDEEMRHGAKSKSKRFNGYKEHIATDVDTGVILACAVTPANVPEQEAAPMLKADIEAHGNTMRELFIDLGYANSTIVAEIEAAGGDVTCKPWPGHNNRGLFSKKDFSIQMRSKTITCPAGETEKFVLGSDVEFDAAACVGCKLRPQCTHSSLDHGRTIRIADDEPRQRRLRRLLSTDAGRAQHRERTAVEHRLAHVAQREGPRARYRGTRKTTFQARRTSAIANLEVAQREMLAS